MCPVAKTAQNEWERSKRTSLNCVRIATSAQLKLDEKHSQFEYEQVILNQELSSGYQRSSQSTVTARPLGARDSGTIRPLKKALIDVLRLARGMTYKSALAGAEPWV